MEYGKTTYESLIHVRTVCLKIQWYMVVYILWSSLSLFLKNYFIHPYINAAIILSLIKHTFSRGNTHVAISSVLLENFLSVYTDSCHFTKFTQVFANSCPLITLLN